MLIVALLSIVILFIKLHRGATAVLAGGALGLVVCCVICDFTPGPFDPRGTRVKAGFICLTVMIFLVIITLLTADFLHQGRRG